MQFLTQQEVETFFNQNNIPLREIKEIGESSVDLIVLNAANFGTAFAGFILISTINLDRNKIDTNFDSFEDLYHCYTCYVIGFNKAGVS